MVVGDSSINNIMSGIENTGTVKQHNHKKKLKQRFDIIKKLGQGTFGKVQLGINKETGQEVAIKTIKKSKIESEADLIRIRREIQIMSSVQHPNIIHIYEVFENREKMVLVMEYAAGGELYDYLSERKVLSEDEARRIFRQIATACYYCHKHKICHRDLKLENILLDENNNAKIADFGLSNVFDDQRLLSTFCGSPLYASPEIVKGTPYQGPEVDCWSLGVLLYTLVYGAMPFDGSNFKRLVKQISQGDYFEPAQPSPASPLIREMLTVNPKNRANIEKICSHWWVNENYDEDCLVISEELANQTPVRLDLLLSLAPPPPQLESDKLLVTADVAEEVKTEVAPPTRSQSVGSLMELSHPAERRIKELLLEEKSSPKRKLETTVSSDKANLEKRKDKIVKENTVADITVHGSSTLPTNTSMEDASMTEATNLPLDKSSTQTLTKEMDVVIPEDTPDPSLQGAVCAEILEEAKQREPKKLNKSKKTLSTSISNKILAGINEIPSQENLANNNNLDKENVEEIAQATKTVTTNNANAVVKDEVKQPAAVAMDTKPKKKIIKKKVLADKNENQAAPPSKEIDDSKESVAAEKDDISPTKPVERRRSRIFEAAEKFQNMISPTETKPVPIEKPKKIVIPGVSVDGFKKEFERKASLTSTSPPKSKTLTSKKSIDKTSDNDNVQSEEVANKEETKVSETAATAVVIDKKAVNDEERKERVRNAVSIISSALDKEGTRKSKSRPCCIRKPPVPFGASGRSASGNIGMLTSPLSPPIGPKPFVRPQFDKPIEVKQVEEPPEQVEENKTSSAEITLKSATLPRRKTTKAEIQLNYPVPKPAAMGFKTEMAHPVSAPSITPTQRSEVVVPVAAPTPVNFKATPPVDATADSQRNSPKEHIIPISFEKTERQTVQSPPAKPPRPLPFQTQKSTSQQRAGSVSRQSTQESDSETTSGEPIRKSPREYIIPIAVEGGGYVTPRAGSLEPSESASTTSTIKRRNNNLGSRARRMNSLLSDRDSEDDSQYGGGLYRHSSFGKDSDTEDAKKDAFHMHRLRSTRPKRTILEHNDSLSSGEEDDDDGFEILTAEHLFSNLLSRVRDLTQKLNVEDGGRPGFPSSRLLSHFDHDTNFWNFSNRLSPLSRHTSLGRSFSRERDSPNTAVPWRRSVSRDLAADIESVFKDQKPATPRGDKKSKKENLNLSDLDLKNLKLTDEDALALSYLTPGLSRRIQKQLFSQLAPSEVKKLQRTLSCNPATTSNATEEAAQNQKLARRSADRISSTLPRRYTSESTSKEPETLYKPYKSQLPVKSRMICEPNIRSSSVGYEPKLKEYDFGNYQKLKTGRSASLREPKSYISKSPESSISESLSRNDNDSFSTDSYSSLSRPSSYSRYSSDSSVLNKYLTPTITTVKENDNKTDLKKSVPRRISRFLRPDFYDSPKEENVVVKEKKERELETQKVLKEIRDKRKSRLSHARRERSVSREKSLEILSDNCEKIDEEKPETTNDLVKETDLILNNVSNNIKNLENCNAIKHDYVNVKASEIDNKLIEKNQGLLHDYVNVPGTTQQPVIKKNRISKLVRPKSYPTENIDKTIKEKSMETEKIIVPEKEKLKVSPEKESKISRLRKGFIRQGSKERDKTKEDKNETNKTINEEEKGHKNKLLQSIEKKLEKFRSNKDSDEMKNKKSGVESAIKKLREQSLPRNLEHCTESGLIKRAVSVEDCSNLGNNNKPLQASRKSVTKILGLFKKYEEQENKKNEKLVKKKQKKNEESVITNGNTDVNCNNDSSQLDSNECNNKKKLERPRSLLLVDRGGKSHNGANTDNNTSDKESKSKGSKLPINSRRSLNLDVDPPKFYKNPMQQQQQQQQPESSNARLDRKNLRLDLNRSPISSSGSEIKIIEPSTSTMPNHNNHNRNSGTDESLFLSPDDNMSDSWSVCSDYHTHDLLSPSSSHNGYICSGDENESVIDRIRRKSFYTRFNEKKRVRKPSLTTRNYKDLDLYKDYSYKTPDYGSLDRRAAPTYDYKPVSRRSSYVSSLPEPKRDYKVYTRSSSLMNDYVNVPNHRYQMYSSRIGRPSTSVYADSDNALDDLLSTAAKSKKYSSQSQPSRLSRNVSPSTEPFYVNRSSSVLSNATSATSPEPI